MKIVHNTKIKEGSPSWDNTNWLNNKNNPFEITKSLDIEFEQFQLAKQQRNFNTNDANTPFITYLSNGEKIFIRSLMIFLI